MQKLESIFGLVNDNINKLSNKIEDSIKGKMANEIKSLISVNRLNTSY